MQDKEKDIVETRPESNRDYKAEARRLMEEEKARQQRAKRNKILTIAAIVVVAIALVVALAVGLKSCSGDVSEVTDPSEQFETILPTEPSDTTNPSETDPVVDNPTDPTEDSETKPTEPEETKPEETIPPETDPSEEETSKPTDPVEKPTEPTTPPTEPTKPTEPVHTHSYTKTVKQPTCTDKGYTTYKCSCGDSYESDVVKAKGHDYKTSSAEPTCDKAGYITRTCSNCGDTHTDNKAALGHKYKDTVVKPTCTAAGYTKHECSRCGHSFKDTETKAKGHDYKVETIAPTYEAEGYDLHTCKTCGNSFQDNWTDKLVEGTKPVGPHTHNYSTNVLVETTCEKNGLVEYKCDCGYSYQHEEEAYGHAFVNGVCQRCGYENPDFQPPTQEGCTTDDGLHEHEEVWVGNIRYIYCEKIESPFRNADSTIIFYPIRFYF